MQSKEQNTDAHELAEFVRGYATANVPSFGDYAKSRYKNFSWERAYECLADEIESLGKQDGLPYPLDKDGIPIKLGETVYRADGKRPFEYQIFNNCEYGMTVETISLHRDHIEITCDYYECPVYYEPKQLIHSNSRTLDDIISDIMYSLEDGVCDNPEEEVNALVHEAYEMGKVAKDE